jgi:hypothetical protein
MQQSTDFITADFLYMFRASSAHHQEYKILTRQPPVQVVMVAGGSSLRHIREESSLIWRSEDPPATITTYSGGCRVSILYSWWWALDARNMQSKSAVIKSVLCCITLVFYVTLYYDALKHKIKTLEEISQLWRWLKRRCVKISIRLWLFIIDLHKRLCIFFCWYLPT